MSKLYEVKIMLPITIYTHGKNVYDAINAAFDTPLTDPAWHFDWDNADVEAEESHEDVERD